MSATNRRFRRLAIAIWLSLMVAACSGPTGDRADPTNGTPDDQATSEPTPSGVVTIPAHDATPTPEGQQQPPPGSGGPTQPTQPPAPTATPEGQVGGAGEPRPGSLLPGHRIISYYGHPSTPVMGVLGSGSMAEVYERLRQQAAEFEAVDPHTPNVLAFEIIATVAQPHPGDDGLYVAYTGDEWIGEYVDFATQHDMIVILDLQIGWNTLVNEIERVRHWLELPNVHVALDPEFSTGANEIPRPWRVPGTLIGEVNGYHVQEVVEILSDLVAHHNLPNKILVVHQFEDEMIFNKHAISPLPGVDIVIDMDGFGPPPVKLTGYNEFVTEELIEYGGIKLFYEQDVPILGPESLMNLTPPPVLIIYQ